MRYFLLIIALALAAAGIYSVFLNSDNPPAYDVLVAEQPNPFYSSADSAAITWRRAELYLETYPAVFGKGGMQITDSVIAISYYNSNKKGNSLRIERKRIGNNIRYNISWWYSRNPEIAGAKEIALFMQQGIDKNDPQFKN